MSLSPRSGGPTPGSCQTKAQWERSLGCGDTPSRTWGQKTSERLRRGSGAGAEQDPRGFSWKEAITTVPRPSPRSAWPPLQTRTSLERAEDAGARTARAGLGSGTVKRSPVTRPFHSGSGKTLPPSGRQAELQHYNDWGMKGSLKIYALQYLLKLELHSIPLWSCYRSNNQDGLIVDTLISR